MHPHRIGVDIVLPLAAKQSIELYLGLGMQEPLEGDEAGVGQRVLRVGVGGAFGLLGQQRQLSALGLAGRAVPCWGAPVVIVGLHRQQLAAQGLEAVGVAARLAEGDVTVFLVCRDKAQAGHEGVQARTGLEGYLLQQIRAHGVVCTPREEVGLAQHF